MGRTLQINLHTTTIILLVVSWLSCNPVWGFPAASRAAPGESMSARRRGGDGLIVGSDFLNVFIGGKVDSAVRSRRYPLVRSDIAEPQQDHSRDSEDTFPSRQLNPSAEGQDFQENNRRSNNNVDPNERLSGLIKSQDRQNYQRFESQDPHNSNKVEHLEEQQRRGVKKFRYIVPVDILREDVYSEVTEDAVIRDVMASEARVFGGRTLPRTSSNAPSTGTTNVPTLATEEITDNYRFSAGDDYLRPSTEVVEVDGLKTKDTDQSETQKNVASEDTDVKNDRINVAGKVSKVSVSPKFSVSSSVHKVTTKEKENLESVILETKKEISNLNNEVFSSSPNYQVPSDIGTSEESQTLPTPDDNIASSTSSPTSTESNEYLNEDDSSTSITFTDSELSTERNEDWPAKLDDSTSDSTVTADVEEIPDGAQFQKVGIPNDRSKSAVQVVSVRVSSSVAQAQPSPVSALREVTGKKNAIVNTIAEESSSIADSSNDSQTSSNSKSDSMSLEIEDHPPVTAIHRSELVVEESSPSEVTALPYTSYTSYLSSNFQSPSTGYYPTPSEDTSTNPQGVPVGYHSNGSPAIAGRRVQYFNHPPSNHRNPTIEALRRSSEDSSSSHNSYVRATVENVSPRRYASHSLSRVPESASVFQSLHKEPVSVAESIQRSIITSQDADRSDTRSGSSRSQFHQDKNAFAAGGFQGIGEQGTYQEQKARSDSREKKSYPGEEYVEKSYGQPERVWGEPEKVYGEPEKVYGEPEKVYGEPEKVYGEPEKVYGEPAKVYGEPAKNYEVDEAVSVMTNGRAHGVQPTQEPTRPTVQQTDAALKMFDSKQQDPNHKFGYVVEGRNFRKYRVEERTSDGFIVGEYGVVSHDDGSLRGVRYTADGTINPRLIYDTLVKFLSL